MPCNISSQTQLNFLSLTNNNGTAFTVPPLIFYEYARRGVLPFVILWLTVEYSVAVQYLLTLTKNGIIFTIPLLGFFANVRGMYFSILSSGPLGNLISSLSVFLNTRITEKWYEIYKCILREFTTYLKEIDSHIIHNSH